jgi:hypothetical protein
MKRKKNISLKMVQIGLIFNQKFRILPKLILYIRLELH